MTEYAIEAGTTITDTLRGLVARLERDEGQDMIEYALLAGLISIVAIAVILLIGPYLRNLFSDVINAVNSA